MNSLSKIAGKNKAAVHTAIRVLFGVMWLAGASWKIPPDFGQNAGDGLFFWVNQAVEFPVLSIYTWFVEQIVLPNFILFGWAVLVTELVLAIGYIVGSKTRSLSLLAFIQITAIVLSVANAPNEWIWTYILMYMVAAMLFVEDTSASKFSLDYLISQKLHKNNPSERSPQK